MALTEHERQVVRAQIMAGLTTKKKHLGRRLALAKQFNCTEVEIYHFVNNNRQLAKSAKEEVSKKRSREAEWKIVRKSFGNFLKRRKIDCRQGSEEWEKLSDEQKKQFEVKEDEDNNDSSEENESNGNKYSAEIDQLIANINESLISLRTMAGIRGVAFLSSEKGDNWVLDPSEEGLIHQWEEIYVQNGVASLMRQFQNIASVQTMNEELQVKTESQDDPENVRRLLKSKIRQTWNLAVSEPQREFPYDELITMNSSYLVSHKSMLYEIFGIPEQAVFKNPDEMSTEELKLFKGVEITFILVIQ